jgi:hypothetical protein
MGSFSGGIPLKDFFSLASEYTFFTFQEVCRKLYSINILFSENLMFIYSSYTIGDTFSHMKTVDDYLATVERYQCITQIAALGYAESYNLTNNLIKN